MLSGINNTETEADVWGASRVLSSRSLVSNLGCTELFIIEHGVKVNDSAYWRDVLLMGDAISNLVHVGDFIIFYQSALQHTGHVTRSNFCAVRPQTSLDLNCGPRTHQTSNRSSIGFWD